MAFVFKDLAGNEHELYEGMKVEQMEDIVTRKVMGYRVKGPFTNYEISKETYEAIKNTIR